MDLVTGTDKSEGIPQDVGEDCGSGGGFCSKLQCVAWIGTILR